MQKNILESQDEYILESQDEIEREIEKMNLNIKEITRVIKEDKRFNINTYPFDSFFKSCELIFMKHQFFPFSTDKIDNKMKKCGENLIILKELVRK